MKTIAVTKGMYREGKAYQDWSGGGELGRIGGPYAELLCESCEDHDPVSLVSLVGQKPVGQINLLKGAVVLAGERVPVYWGSGFVVPEEHRATGAGMALMARMRSLTPGTGAVSISQLALPLYTKLGWQCLGAQRHLMLARPSVYLKHRLGRSAPIRFLGRLADGAAKVHRWLVRGVLGMLTPRLEQQVLQDFAGISDSWFAKHTDQPYATERSAAWLRRIMSLGPQDNARRLHLILGSDRQVIGYFVTALARREGVGNGRFGDLMVASLRDWVSFDRVSLPERAVMLMGLRELLKAECDVVELCVPNGQPSRLPAILGMVKMGELNFALRLGPEWVRRHPDLARPDLWWFRPGDGDAFLL
jgi:GNAT superfamily N-acetyltransferase